MKISRLFKRRAGFVVKVKWSRRDGAVRVMQVYGVTARDEQEAKTTVEHHVRRQFTPVSITHVTAVRCTATPTQAHTD